MTTPVEIKKTEKFSVLEAKGASASAEAEKPATVAAPAPAPAPVAAADGQKQNQGKKKCESFIIFYHSSLYVGDQGFGFLIRVKCWVVNILLS